MAIPKRHISRPGTYFVTSRTWESRALFVADEFCEVFVKSLLHYREEGAFSLHAFVLMRDHFHALLTPAPDKTLERVVQFIKGGSARRLSLEKNIHLPVWQRGFSDHRIRDARDYSCHEEYIALNPVRKRIVFEATEFQWSSACGKYKLDKPPQGLKPEERGGGTSVRHG